MAARPGLASLATIGSRIWTPGAGTTQSAEGAPYDRAATAAMPLSAARSGSRVKICSGNGGSGYG